MKIRGQEVLDPKKRIMSHVVVNETTGCWEWRGSFRGTEKLRRYGRLLVGSRMTGGRRTVSAHRYAWEVFRGPLQEGQWVLHRCDNPPCCNPDHLFLGDRAANVADREAKGRNVVPLGEDQGNAKLTATQVLEIRETYRPGVVTYRMLAERFGVKKTTIKTILQRKNWAWLPAPPGAIPLVETEKETT